MTQGITSIDKEAIASSIGAQFNGTLFQFGGFDIDSTRGRKAYYANNPGLRSPGTLSDFKVKAAFRWAQSWNKMMKASMNANNANNRTEA